jgi:hypothetical protein
MPDPLGHSLRLDDGDLVFDGDTLAAVSGKENLVQALVLRVQTPLGNDAFDGRYGLDVRQIFTQGTGARVVRELIRLNLVRTLGTDARVREVRDVVFPDEADVVAQRPGANAEAARLRRQSRLWRVEVTLVTVDEGQESLQLTLGG